MQINANFAGNIFSWTVNDDVLGELEISAKGNSSYDEFVKIVLARDFKMVPDKYVKMSEHFVSSSNVVSMLIPKHELKSSLREAEMILCKAFEQQETRSYFQTWSKIYTFLQKMQRAKIDNVALEQLKAFSVNENSGVLRSFEPDQSGYAKKVKYTTAGSVTGRLSVLSGPQILTAPKEVRSCITPSSPEYSVMIVDFISVEPRLAMMTVGLTPKIDVYEDILEEFSIDRKTAKLVTLSALYGSGAKGIAGISGDMSAARKAISFVRSIFRVESMERKLNEQAEKGLVRNIFGRPLREATKNPRVRVNHYLQSSAAELSVLLFSELCDSLQDSVRPLFIIHDALVVEVKNACMNEFIENASSISWNNIPIPVKVERL